MNYNQMLKLSSCTQSFCLVRAIANTVANCVVSRGQTWVWLRETTNCARYFVNLY